MITSHTFKHIHKIFKGRKMCSMWHKNIVISSPKNMELVVNFIHKARFFCVSEEKKCINLIKRN